MTVRIARWSATHPWRAMALWTAFVLVCIALGSVVGTKESTQDGDVGETHRASQIYDTTKEILRLAQSDGVPPAVAADQLAERRMAEVGRLRTILV